MRHAGALCIAAIAIATGCGPSLRRTYQSDVAFATCFDADYAAQIDAAQKRACWETWIAGRIVNQPEDKERYARLRLRELEAGVSVPGPPGPPGKFDERPAPELASHTPTAPQRTQSPPSKPPSFEFQPLDVPGARCRETCRRSLLACQTTCNAAKKSTEESPGPCSAACGSGFMECMKSCAAEVNELHGKTQGSQAPAQRP
ncbi:MAG: hypothetical protein MUC50_21980 [Myxococcota bacterium]|nr:hypothetical protein [Myxococcota bacterium]